MPPHLVFIALSDAGLSEARVMQRVAQGGHEVPSDRLARRFHQSLANLAEAIPFAPDVRVFDNSDTDHPFRLVLCSQRGQVTFRAHPFPKWLAAVAGA